MAKRKITGKATTKRRPKRRYLMTITLSGLLEGTFSFEIETWNLPDLINDWVFEPEGKEWPEDMELEELPTEEAVDLIALAINSEIEENYPNVMAWLDDHDYFFISFYDEGLLDEIDVEVEIAVVDQEVTVKKGKTTNE